MKIMELEMSQEQMIELAAMIRVRQEIHDTMTSPKVGKNPIGEIVAGMGILESKVDALLLLLESKAAFTAENYSKAWGDAIRVTIKNNSAVLSQIKKDFKLG
tara:strand:+ start:35584 stop:35889 length:306 start_codon:yes stop_codon:yes gene_type:complete